MCFKCGERRWQGEVQSVWLLMRSFTRRRGLLFPQRILRARWQWGRARVSHGGLHSLWLAQPEAGIGWGINRNNLMPNPWSVKQPSIITSYLLGKYDLLFGVLIYGLVFRSTLWQEAAHPIQPILFQASLFEWKQCLFICFFLMKSVIPFAPPNPVVYYIK